MCVETNVMGVVETFEACGASVSPSRTRTRSRSRSSAGSSCTSDSLGYSSFSADFACAMASFGPTTFYFTTSFQSGARVYTNSACTSQSSAGYYSDGFSVFQKTSSTGTLTNGSICLI